MVIPLLANQDLTSMLIRPYVNAHFFLIRIKFIKILRFKNQDWELLYIRCIILLVD